MLTEGLLPSRLKVALYRSRGAEIGDDVSIGPMSVVDAKRLRIGSGTRIGFASIVRGREVTLGRKVQIGSTTFLDVEVIEIGDDTKINEQVFAGGPTLPESRLTIGARCIVMQHTFLNPTKPLVIGDDTGVGGKCSIFTHGSWQNQLEGYPVKFAPVELGRGVWIPWQVFIMPGVTIGDGATIGAGSLVTKDVPAGALAAGSPAKVLKTADEYPRRPDEDARRAMMREIMGEFLRYLEYYGYASKGFGGGTSSIEIEARDGTKRTLWYREAGPLAIAGDRGGVLLAMDGVSDAERSDLKRRQIPWLDVAARERSFRDNDLCEELAHFLARYGIRCVRLD